MFVYRLTVKEDFLNSFYSTWTNFIGKVELIDRFMIHNKRKMMNIEFKRLMLKSFKAKHNEIYMKFVHRLIDEALEYFVINKRLFFNENSDGCKMVSLSELMESIKFAQDVISIVNMFINSNSGDVEAYFKDGLNRRLESLFETERRELEGQKIKYINYVLHRGMEREYVIKQLQLERWHEDITSIYKSSILGVFAENFIPSLSYSEQEKLFFAASEEEFVNLKKLHGIFSLYDDIKAFEKFLFTYITHAGAEIIERNKKPDSTDKCTLLQDLVAFKSYLDKMAKVALNESVDITATIHNAFEAITEGDSISNKLISEEIVKYFIDETSSDTINLEESKRFVECVTFILRATVPEKDEFEVIYRTRLSEELMKRGSKPSDQKKFRETAATFIDKYLSSEFGVSFLKKINGIIEDLKVSDEIVQSFSTAEPRSISFDMRILTRPYWPESVIPTSESVAASTSSLVLPKEMSAVINDFCSFFASKEKRNQFMKLDMDCFYATSSVYVEGRFPRAGVKTLITPLPEALVLMCFEEDGSSTTLGDITKRTGIREGDAKKIIRVFSSKNVGILKVDTESSGQVISVNDLFESKKTVIRIKKKAPKESSQAHVDQQADSAEKRELIFKREEHVDCLLMRALKGTKPKTIGEIMEFVSQWTAEQKFFVGFKPDQEYVVGRLKSLIKMSYVVKKGSEYLYNP